MSMLDNSDCNFIKNDGEDVSIVAAGDNESGSRGDSLADFNNEGSKIKGSQDKHGSSGDSSLGNNIDSTPRQRHRSLGSRRHYFDHEEARHEGRGGNPHKVKRKLFGFVPTALETIEELFTSEISAGVNLPESDNIEVSVIFNETSSPASTFESSALRAPLLENIKGSYGKLTTIQRHPKQVVRRGRDLISRAPPLIIELLIHNPLMTEGKRAYPEAIIMSPTRELAIQIEDQGKIFAYNSTFKVAVIVYGENSSIFHQRCSIMADCHGLVATPRRFNNFVEGGYVPFLNLKYFDLDKADRMMDMSLSEDVKEMLSLETLFPIEIQDLAKKFLHDCLTLGTVRSSRRDVHLQVFQFDKLDKDHKLISILGEFPNEKILVFVSNKRTADILTMFLKEESTQSICFHGDSYQNEQEQALLDFITGQREVLFAPNISIRRLDIEDVQHIINYELPKSIDEYVRSIGSAWCMGSYGRATSSCDEDLNQHLACGLTEVVSQSDQQSPDGLDG